MWITSKMRSFFFRNMEKPNREDEGLGVDQEVEPPPGIPSSDTQEAPQSPILGTSRAVAVVIGSPSTSQSLVRRAESEKETIQKLQTEIKRLQDEIATLEQMMEEGPSDDQEIVSRCDDNVPTEACVRCASCDEQLGIGSDFCQNCEVDSKVTSEAVQILRDPDQEWAPKCEKVFRVTPEGCRSTTIVNKEQGLVLQVKDKGVNTGGTLMVSEKAELHNLSVHLAMGKLRYQYKQKFVYKVAGIEIECQLDLARSSSLLSRQFFEQKIEEFRANCSTSIEIEEYQTLIAPLYPTELPLEADGKVNLPVTIDSEEVIVTFLLIKPVEGSEFRWTCVLGESVAKGTFWNLLWFDPLWSERRELYEALGSAGTESEG